MRRRALLSFAASLLAALALAGSGPAIRTVEAQARAVAPTSPDTFFGFQLGSDRNLARWDRMVEYYRLLEKETGKLRVVDMGPSTMGHPFLLTIISAPENLAKLDRLRQVNAQISDPRGLSEADVRKLVAEGKAVVVQTMSMH